MRYKTTEKNKNMDMLIQYYKLWCYAVVITSYNFTLLIIESRVLLHTKASQEL